MSGGHLRYWLADEGINPDKEYAGELISRMEASPSSRSLPKIRSHQE